MSDEMAAKAEAEVQQQKTAEQTAQETKQKELWILSIFFDKHTGAVEVQTNENVTTQWQVDTMIAQLQKKMQVAVQGRITADMMSAVMDSKRKPGLFGKK